MFKGYYTLTSSMLTQNRNLNVISNNLTNVSTPGFKADKAAIGSFQEELLSRVGNIDKKNPTRLNNISMINTIYETVTNYEQGAYEETGSLLDFAITDKGFFRIQTENGMVYTRNGSFIIDNEGYLSLPRVGRVMGKKGPIHLDSDKISVDNMGGIYTEGNQLIDRIDIVDFADYHQLTKAGEGIFTSNAAANSVQPEILWKTLEMSNVNHIEEFTAMMSSQRALQSAGQILKMYDQIAGKASTEIGRV